MTRIAAYLDHRAARWPNTTNAHLFANTRTGLTTAPVSRHWVNATLGMAAQAIRQDRILDEANATGGDLRRICDLFGITVIAATHYTSSLDQGPTPARRAYRRHPSDQPRSAVPDAR